MERRGRRDPLQICPEGRGGAVAYAPQEGRAAALRQELPPPLDELPPSLRQARPDRS
ncbi:hypothetical protein Ahy_A06g029207 isoform B [Arachis hypogaea]|uniref:Uncharacterized protein n=1 Tax=Arachis hypogaea TaxID=3818 RepID=A0A445CSL0_ARAHY|nr:hypothetical protein Ahy_A06g029207 isoform B [Arachis hypogaea]